MAALDPYLAYEFGEATIYALFFLLGSLAVSTLSDLKRMRAQREFLEVWVLFTIVLLALDGRRTTLVGTGEAWTYFGVKWGLIALLGLASWHRTGVVFRLAIADVLAIVAVCSVFNPLFILVFYALLWVSNQVLRPLLRIFGDHAGYPFLPAVLGATVLTLCLILLDVGTWLAEQLPG